MFKFLSKKRNQKGFTLIELIVVIAILGILAAIAVPRFTGMRHEATLKSEASTAASIMSAARVQEAETGNVVNSGTTAVVNAASTTIAAGEIDKKYMIIPTEGPGYIINKTGDSYVVTWETAAGGDYASKSQRLVEGSQFSPNTAETLPTL